MTHLMFSQKKGRSKNKKPWTLQKWIKMGFWLSVFFLIFLIAAILIADRAVERAAEGKLYSSVEEIPKNKVGLLLGTGRFAPDGQVNAYYLYRIQAAAELHEAKKIDFVLVSGDNSRATYDEPSAMKEDLIKEGIPEEKIVLDYAGFRTLDSIVRAKEVFGQEKLTVISQPFHNERALYLAQAKGVEATGFNAKEPNIAVTPRIHAREKLARLKMMLDLIVGKGPKFLGEKVEIE